MVLCFGVIEMRRNIAIVQWIVVALVAIMVLTAPATATITNEGLNADGSGKIQGVELILTLEEVNISEIVNKSVSSSAESSSSVDTNIRWLGQSISLDEIAWKPDGSYGLIVGYGSIVLKYDGSDFTVLNTNLGFDPYGVEWKPDGSYALIAGSGGKITKYNGTGFITLASPMASILHLSPAIQPQI